MLLNILLIELSVSEKATSPPINLFTEDSAPINSSLFICEDSVLISSVTLSPNSFKSLDSSSSLGIFSLIDCEGSSLNHIVMLSPPLPPSWDFLKYVNPFLTPKPSGSVLTSAVFFDHSCIFPKLEYP